MHNPTFRCHAARWLKLAAGTLLVGVALAGTPAAAEEPLAEATALKFVPGDTGLYVSWLRNKQQVDSLLQSEHGSNAQVTPSGMPSTRSAPMMVPQ